MLLGASFWPLTDVMRGIIIIPAWAFLLRPGHQAHFGGPFLLFVFIQSKQVDINIRDSQENHHVYWNVQSFALFHWLKNLARQLSFNH